MAEIRKDLVKNHWVALANDRALKPCDFPIAKKKIHASELAEFCPFCLGNEAFTPPEIKAVRAQDSLPNEPGWDIRLIPNKFSAFSLDNELNHYNKGVYSYTNGLGKHEVLLETPEHGVEIQDYDLPKIRGIIKLLKQRYNELSLEKRIKYIQIYKNRGMLAGASLEHSHSQILGFPFVPPENKGMIDYFQEKGHCLLCDIIKQEKELSPRLILNSEHFIIICPFAARFSYESWLIPKRHTEHFGDINAAEIEEMAALLKRFIGAILTGLMDPAYNLVINTAPVNVEYKEGYHWYMEIIPRMLVAAGVEVATGIYINPVAPELAAGILRDNLKSL